MVAESAMWDSLMMANMVNPTILITESVIVDPLPGIKTVIKMLKRNPPIMATFPGKK